MIYIQHIMNSNKIRLKGNIRYIIMIETYAKGIK